MRTVRPLRRSRAGWVLAGSVLALLAVAGLGAGILLGTGYVYRPVGVTVAPAELAAAFAALDRETLVELTGALEVEQRRLRRELDRRTPKGRYVVIDRTHNRLLVKDGDTVLLFAVCSVGSGTVLRDIATGREWVFDTPRGQFTVRAKIRNPVWRKPDWAFVEAAEPVPSDPRDRFEYGVLGDYALDLGDGYLIHGTLYERLLGRSVTHGCVRLGRDDLRDVYALARVGTPVYIF